MGKIWGNLGTVNEAGKDLGPPGESGEIWGRFGGISGPPGVNWGMILGVSGGFPTHLPSLQRFAGEEELGGPVATRHDVTVQRGEGRLREGGEGRLGLAPGARRGRARLPRPNARAAARLHRGSSPAAAAAPGGHRGSPGGPGPPPEIRDPPRKPGPPHKPRPPRPTDPPNPPGAPGTAQGGSRCSPPSPRVGPGRTRHRDRADVTATSLPPEVVTGRGNGEGDFR